MSVIAAREGRVLVVTLDRPEARNAFDSATIEAMIDIFDLVAAKPAPRVEDDLADPEVRPQVVLLRSEGPVFCAGADLQDMKRFGGADFETNLQAATTMGAMFRAVRLCPAPVVARVQGPAYGGGVGLCCSCDVVVAAADARFTFSEVRLGLVAGVIAPLVIDRIGQAAARHYFLTGDVIRSVDALRIGLVDRLAGQEGLDEAVDRTVGSLLKGGPDALGLIKSLVEGSVSLGFERSLDFCARMIAQARTGAEAQSALTAFFAKQPPRWAEDLRWPARKEDS